MTWAFPFDLVDPVTRQVLIKQGDDPSASVESCMSSSWEGGTLCLDFSPMKKVGLGIYPNDVGCETATKKTATGLPYRGEYKSAVFRDVITNTAKGEVILDLGCYNCELLRLFPDHAIRIGVDISANSLFGGTPNALDSGVESVWICNAVQLPLPDNTADTILCCDLLEHLLEPKTLLAEIFRVLKPGGTLVVTVPNLVHLGNRLSMVAGIGTGVELAQLLKLRTPFLAPSGPRFPDQDIHLRWFTSSSLSRYVSDMGFHVVCNFGCGPIVTRLRLNRLMHTMALLTGVVARKPLTQDLAGASKASNTTSLSGATPL